MLFRYDPETLEFTSSFNPQKDPSTGELMSYPYTTDREPLKAKGGFAVVFNGEDSEYVEDHRGKTVYKKDDKSSHLVDYLGSIPNLYTEKQPAQGSEWDGDTDNWVKTPEQLAVEENAIMAQNLQWCDLQIKLHASSDSRAVATLDEIYAYARGCRNRVINGLIDESVNPVRPV